MAGGSEMLTGDSSGFTGLTTVQAGMLSVNGLLGGTMNVDAGGRLQGTGTVGATTNAGVIAPGNSIGTLTVLGNYTGNGGTLEIESVLGGDASPSDRLVVTGNTSGATNVKVFNLGGGGGPTVEGIKIVDVGGASNGAFSLLGDYVFHGQQVAIGGAYAYTLQKNGIATPADGDWYLRSSLLNPPLAAPAGPIYQPGVPLYEVYPQVLAALNRLPTLRQRVGNRYWNAGAVNVSSAASGDQPDGRHSMVWGRAGGSYMRSDFANSVTVENARIGQWMARTGIDALLYQSEGGMLVGAVTGHYGQARASVRSPYGDGRIEIAGYGFGSTLTWYGVNGFYVDGQAQLTRFDSDLKSDLVSRPMANGIGGLGYAFSVETGKRFGMGGPWSLTPQAQLVYAKLDADFTDNFGARISLDNDDSLTGRLGLALDHQQSWRDASGALSRSSVYGIANVYYEFMDGTSVVDVSGTDFASDHEQLAAGFGVGGTYNWDNDKYSIYGEALIKTSFNSDYAVGGNVGFRMKW